MLKIKDKCLVEDGSRLTDKHINLANCLIAHQFSKMDGLHAILLKTMYYCFPPESIQAIFCKRCKHCGSQFLNEWWHQSKCVWFFACKTRSRKYWAKPLQYEGRKAVIIVMKNLLAKTRKINRPWFVCDCCDGITGTQRRSKCIIFEPANSHFSEFAWADSTIGRKNHQFNQVL